MSYRFVAAERAAFPVRTLCRLVGVAVSGFYAWLRRRPGRRREDDRRVSERVGAIFAASRRTYGSPRVHASLALAVAEPQLPPRGRPRATGSAANGWPD